MIEEIVCDKSYFKIETILFVINFVKILFVIYLHREKILEKKVEKAVIIQEKKESKFKMR